MFWAVNDMLKSNVCVCGGGGGGGEGYKLGKPWVFSEKFSHADAEGVRGHNTFKVNC